MNINFTFKGTEHNARVLKVAENDIQVIVKDAQLQRQFGSSFLYHLDHHSIQFEPLNPGHSDLYNLQCNISKAIQEQTGKY